MMGYVFDVNVGKPVVDYFRTKGFDITSVQELNPQIDDDEILRMAVEQNRILITLDKDFGELVYRISQSTVVFCF